MLLGSLSENLITLLCYDKERAPIIRGVVDIAMFGGVHRALVARIYSFIDRFKRPPEDHLPDILSDILEGNNPREAALYAEIIEQIHAAKTGINGPYVMSQLETFIKRQSLRSIAVDLTKALQRDTEESLEQAEQLLASANRSTLSVFDPGVRLSDKKRALEFLDVSSAALPTGIPELDRRGFGPTRKELLLAIANAKAGKTWWLIHLAKMALVSRAKVLHITLEMSEARCSQRYFQALFAMSKRLEVFQNIKFKRDTDGQFIGFEYPQLTPKLTLDDPTIRSKLEGKIDRWGLRLLDNIIIKQFPTGQLTMPMLTAYLDNLEATEQFVPDLLIIDYPDLMKLDINNLRLATGQVYKDIRGLLVTRNMAGVVVSQSHRAAAGSKQVGAHNVSEDYSKIAHADTIMTYAQTTSEQKLGLARIYVAGGRNDSDKLTVMISQQYGTGSFVVDSGLLVASYWQQLPQEESI